MYTAVIVLFAVCALLFCYLIYEVEKLNNDKERTRIEIERINNRLSELKSRIGDMEEKNKFYLNEAKSFHSAITKLDNLSNAVKEISDDLYERIEVVAIEEKEQHEYPQEYKDECARFAKEECSSIREASRKLGINYSTLQRWVRQAKK